jgi:hypothetical protein
VRRALLAVVLAAVALVCTLSRAHAAPSEGVVARVAAASEAFRTATEVEGTEDRESAFRDAARLYEDVLDGGLRNGALHYNAANAWMLSGDVGRAILHYRRALLVRPGDPRALANLETARQRRLDRFEETSAGALTGTLFFWHTGLSLGAKVPLAAGAWALGFGLLAIGVWLPAGRGGKRGATRVGAFALLVAVAVGVSVVIEWREREARDAAVILVEEVALRTGDGASYPERYENPVHNGAEVRVVEERGGWMDIELPDGKRGWVPAGSLERV